MIGDAVPLLIRWGDFGLAGMVIGALFITIWLIGKNILIKLFELQREERREWLETFKTITTQADRRQEETNLAIRELSVVVQEMNSRQRRFDRNDDGKG